MHPFLVHRLEVADALQGKMWKSRINAFDAQFGIRARVGDPSSDIVKQARDYNASPAAKTDREGVAKKALESYLTGPQASPKAGLLAKDMQTELDLLAGYITAILPRANWIKGPLKKVPKAMGKTEKDYAWLFNNNKDLVRGTLACEAQSDLLQIATLVVKTCVRVFAMSLMKKQEQKSTRDNGQMEAGYSGWNFVVDFKEHKFGAEIQANTFSMMYGKMSKADFCQQLNVSVAQYEDRRRKARFPGGLGHALYDIQDDRSKASKEDKDKARALALDYNDLCRNGDRKPTIQDINSRIRAMSFKSVFAIIHWNDAVAGCGGLM